MTTCFTADGATRSVLTALGVVVMLAAPVVGQEDTGGLRGRVARADGSGVGGVSVVLNETSAATVTGGNGEFSFTGLPRAVYSLTLALGENLVTLSNLGVAEGVTTVIEEIVDWETGFGENLIVVAPSRRVERVVEAPGAVTRVPEYEIAEEATHAQLPKLLEFTPGAEITQSGVYDFNLNTRGFNSSLTRRVVTLIDGRDPSVPFLGAQEWSAVSFPLDDLASLEFLRGPSAALYGANASSGVLNMTTKAPRYSQGGLARVAFGQLDTVNFDFRWAGEVGNNWYAKVVGGVRDSGDFSVSRNGAAEYSTPCAPGASGDCLPQEVVPLERVSDDQIFFGGVRFDRYLENGMVLTGEGGLTDLAGPVIQTGLGRVQLLEVRRPWARFNVHADRFNLAADYTGRKAPDQLSLASGSNFALDTSRVHVEGQTNWSLAQDTVRVVVGASAEVLDFDSFDERLGRQTLIFERSDADEQALFGQADWNITDQLKLVLAGRGDFSNMHDFQFSPKGSIVYAFDSNHSLRFTYNEAFQVANYGEFFLQADAAPPVDLSALNGVCAPFGVDCGFGVTRVLALGNEDLELEQISTWEIGYKGVLGGRAFLTLDYYNSDASNFITDLLPQLGTALGRVNPNFGPWQAPAGLPAPAAALVRALAPSILSNNLDGSPILAAASYSNFGQVSTQGIDVGLNYYLPAGWRTSVAYSWFDFEIEDALPGFDTLLLPNSPEHTFSAGLAYARDQLDAGLNVRWVDEFRWGVGAFQGDVEAYATVDLTANYALSDSTSIGLNVSNLLDNRHWESFGGDLLRRRALVSLGFTW